jgi:hypothetical protein
MILAFECDDDTMLAEGQLSAEYVRVSMSSG